MVWITFYCLFIPFFLTQVNLRVIRYSHRRGVRLFVECKDNLIFEGVLIFMNLHSSNQYVWYARVTPLSHVWCYVEFGVNVEINGNKI